MQRLDLMRRFVPIAFVVALCITAFAGEGTKSSIQSTGYTDVLFNNNVVTTSVVAMDPTAQLSGIPTSVSPIPAAPSRHKSVHPANVPFRVVSSTGIELGGAMAYFLPSGRAVMVDPSGFLSTDVVAGNDDQIFIVHPGYALFESSYPPQGDNLVVRSAIDASDAQRFAALPELNKILEMCKPLVGHTSDETVLSPGTNPTSTAQITVSIEAAGLESHATPQSLTPKVEGDVVLTLDVMPNPTQDKASIRFTLKNEASVMLELYRLDNGQRVVLEDYGTKPAGENTLSLNLSSLVAGSYAVLLRSSSCQYALSTFVKN